MSQAVPTEPRGGSGEMFDSIAKRYDLLNRIISLGIDQRWRKRTVEALRVRPGDTVLDLATGTGDLAILIARTHPGAEVVGTDPSQNMLAIAEAKGSKASLSTRFLRGDAQSIELGDASVDSVSMAFGIRNVVDRPRALREMVRVTKPGGRIAILELSDPKTGPLSIFARAYIHSIVPRIGAFISGSREYRYLERSIAAFPPPEAFAELMRDAGMVEVVASPLTFGVSCLFVGRVPEASTKA